MEVAKETVCRIASPIEEFRLGIVNKNLLNIEIKDCPIAISVAEYNMRIANMVDHLLMLDQKMFEVDKTDMGAA